MTGHNLTEGAENIYSVYDQIGHIGEDNNKIDRHIVPANMIATEDTGGLVFKSVLDDNGVVGIAGGRNTAKLSLETNAWENLENILDDSGRFSEGGGTAEYGDASGGGGRNGGDEY